MSDLYRQNFPTLSKRKLKVGAIDGTVFGNLEGSVLAILVHQNLPVDFERSAGRGNELTASKTLLKRIGEKLGKGFFDIIVGGGNGSVVGRKTQFFISRKARKDRKEKL